MADEYEYRSPVEEWRETGRAIADAPRRIGRGLRGHDRILDLVREHVGTDDLQAHFEGKTRAEVAAVVAEAVADERDPYRSSTLDEVVSEIRGTDAADAGSPDGSVDGPLDPNDPNDRRQVEAGYQGGPGRLDVGQPSAESRILTELLKTMDANHAAANRRGDSRIPERQLRDAIYRAAERLDFDLNDYDMQAVIDEFRVRAGITTDREPSDTLLGDYVARGGRGLREYQLARDRITGRHRYLLDPNAYDENGDPVVPGTTRPDAGGFNAATGETTVPGQANFNPEAQAIGGGSPLRPTTGESIARRTGARTPDQVERAVNARRYGDDNEPVEFAKYIEGDQLLPAGWSSARIAAHQRELIEAGLLNGEFTYGVYDLATRDAHQNLLMQANGQGAYWHQVMPDLQQAHQRGLDTILADTIRPYEEVSPWQAPSKNDLRLTVHDAVQEALGRKPTAEEMEALTGELNRSYRAQYDADRAVYMAQQGATAESPLESIPEDMRTDEDRARIAEFDAGVADQYGSVDDLPAQVDPGSNLAVKIQQMFGDQIARQGQQAGDEANQAAFSHIAGNVFRRMSGG